MNDYYFTLHDPTTRQPGKPKLGFVLKTMLAIVRPGFANDLLVAGAFILILLLRGEFVELILMKYYLVCKQFDSCLQ